MRNQAQEPGKEPEHERERAADRRAPNRRFLGFGAAGRAGAATLVKVRREGALGAEVDRVGVATLPAPAFRVVGFASERGFLCGEGTA